MTTNNNFFDLSKEVANNFLQNIVFIDDKAYQQEEGNDIYDFDALKITQAFAKEQKICAVFKPETSDDIDNLVLLAKKADITVIDWQINLLENVQDDEEEEDSEDDDPRGPHTRKIIREILTDPLTGKGSLKLIIVYTGETDLQGIAAEIHSDLNTIQLDSKLGNCSISTDNIKILVISKPSADEAEKEGKFKHLPEFKDKIVSYDDLPDFILTEFTKMTSGLLSNVALSALTILRKNSYKILNLFSNKMDSAYLSHKSLLPNPNDAEQLLIELMSGSIGDLFLYSELDLVINENAVTEWMMSSLSSERQPIVNKRGNQINNKDFERTPELLKKLLNESEPNVEKKYRAVFRKIEQFDNLSKIQKDEFLEYIMKNSISLFISNAQTDAKDINKKFATLTHHKNLFMPSPIIPKLSLGTVIKGTKTKDYWVCIQQKCDSIRIYSQERKFLFLPLKIINDNSTFNFISPDGEHLKLVNKSYSIRTIKFIGDEDKGVVKGEKINEEYIFRQFYNEDSDENFIWIFDLKDLHAQRIANNYATQLSRVGLDESEWLRRWAGN